jgi:hypothetical protein
VISWFQAFAFKLNLYRYTSDVSRIFNTGIFNEVTPETVDTRDGRAGTPTPGCHSLTWNIPAVTTWYLRPCARRRAVALTPGGCHSIGYMDTIPALS